MKVNYIILNTNIVIRSDYVINVFFHLKNFNYFTT